jgi:hypothetical protein
LNKLIEYKIKNQILTQTLLLSNMATPEQHHSVEKNNEKISVKSAKRESDN